MEEQEVIPKTLKRKKQTVYILTAYLKPRLTFKRFIKKGKNIDMKEAGELPNLLSLTQMSDTSDCSYNSICYSDKKTGSVVVCGKRQIFRYNLVTGQCESKLLTHGMKRICNMNLWKDFQIFCPADDYLYFVNKDRAVQSSRSDVKFAGEFSGGYNAYSRNSEVVGDTLIFIGISLESGKEVYGLYSINLTTHLAAKNKGEYLDPFGFKKPQENLGHQGTITFFEDQQKPFIDQCKVIPCVQLVASNVNTFFIDKRSVFFADRGGSIFKLRDPLSSSMKPGVEFDKLVEFCGEFTTMNYFHHNIVGGSFGSGCTNLHLYNIKTKMTTELVIPASPKPIHKIEMFIKNKLTFGIALNKGFDMHVFGIHLCKMYIFRSKVKIAAEYISGIMYIEGVKNTVLIFGDSGYNMRFRITL